MRYNLKSSQGKNEAFPQISKEVPDLKKKLGFPFPSKYRFIINLSLRKKAKQSTSTLPSQGLNTPIRSAFTARDLSLLACNKRNLACVVHSSVLIAYNRISDTEAE
jgi:hypothetical protein